MIVGHKTSLLCSSSVAQEFASAAFSFGMVTNSGYEIAWFDGFLIADSGPPLAAATAVAAECDLAAVDVDGVVVIAPAPPSPPPGQQEQQQLAPPCRPLCPDSLLGNGNCDAECNHASCAFDRNDCAIGSNSNSNPVPAVGGGGAIASVVIGARKTTTSCLR